MPAGTDLVTWSPRVGDSGDDRYSWPPERPLFAGSSSYSDPPTLAEVNAGTGINQIIAEYNRRRPREGSLGDVLDWEDFPAVDYLDTGDRLSEAGLYTLARNLRTAELNSVNPEFAQDYSRFSLARYFAMRKNLATDHVTLWLQGSGYEEASPGVEKCTLVKANVRKAVYRKDGGTAVLASGFAGGAIGARSVASRYRGFLKFSCPSWLLSASSARLDAGTNVSTFSFNFTGKVYLSEDYTGALQPSHWGLLSSAIDAANIAVTGGTTTQTGTTVIPPSPGRSTYILTSADEKAGIFPRTPSRFILYQQSNTRYPIVLRVYV